MILTLRENERHCFKYELDPESDAFYVIENVIYLKHRDGDAEDSIFCYAFFDESEADKVAGVMGSIIINDIPSVYNEIEVTYEQPEQYELEKFISGSDRGMEIDLEKDGGCIYGYDAEGGGWIYGY